MKPYYQDSAVTIYHGDCREIVPTLGKFDLLLTDPPYEIRTGGGGIHSRRDGLKNISSMGIDSFEPTDFMPMLWGCVQHAYIWTSKGCLESFTRWIAETGCNWDLLTMAKRNPIPAKNNKYLPDSETILFIRGEGCYWNNDAPYDFYRKVKWCEVHPPEFGHPTEKPISICGELITISTKEGHTILDPFAGSGTTGRAAKDLGRKCTLIEREEKYCEIAARRMGQEVFAM